ncbi:hypothetical protein CVIRNUC_004772 [Coccomyxa viridis]|uniref:Uncharacterized protein n=1 Tax=Coccomyxa viridis TaxID=1274662 RepID=A0AAV1I4B1_9CHLO|nr:hypothetical protein CVIRNUC_004772 [Coccomyxa viridis]
MQHTALRSSCRPFAAIQSSHRRPYTAQAGCSSAVGSDRKDEVSLVSTSRRCALLSAALTAGALARGGPANAGLLQDITKNVVRPELGSTDALVMMMDARGMLYELKDLAATPRDSRERFEARRLLPGMAKRIREVGQAAPVVAALIKGTDKERVVSEQYGGSGGDNASTDAVYAAIGNVVTISGRTIRKEAQAQPELSEVAIEKIDELLAKVPEDSKQKAHDFRAQRRAVAA